MATMQRRSTDEAVDQNDQQLIGQELVPFAMSATRTSGQETHEAFLAAAQEPVLATQAIRDRSPDQPAEQRSEVNGVGGSSVREMEVPQRPIGIPQSFGPSGQETRSPEGPGFGTPSMVPLFDQEQLNRLHALQQQAAWMYPNRMVMEAGGDVPRPPALNAELRGDRGVEHFDIFSPQMRTAALQGAQGAGQLLLEELRMVRQSQLELKLENLKLKKEVDRIQGEQNAKFYTPEKMDPETPRVGRCPDPNELPSFKGAGNFPECQGPSVRLCPKEFQGDGGAQGLGRGQGQQTTSPGDPTFQVLVKLMEGMQALQGRLLDDRDGDRQGGVENVQGNAPQLPPLVEWNPATGPIDLGDWFTVIEPAMSDLSRTSNEWWSLLMEECYKWYTAHMQLQPLQRMDHEPSPSSKLSQSRWKRLERKASSLLLMSLPLAQREDLVSSKKVTAMQIICQLLVQYQPGGLGEKELILKSLESPGEATTTAEAVQNLRRWQRWRRRAKELKVTEPDPFLLVRGLSRIIKKPLEQHRDLSFRISLARSTLQIDATPTAETVGSFAMHLLAEFEQMTHSEVQANKKKDQGENKQKAFRQNEQGGGGRQQEDKPSSPPQHGDQTRETPPCRFYLSDGGCKKGRSCKFGHDLRDDRRRCYHCGCPDHLAPQCTRGDSPPKQKLMRNKQQSQQQREEQRSQVSGSETQSNTGKESVAALLEEANKMLKTLSTESQEENGSSSGNRGSTTTSTARDTTSSTMTAGEKGREDMLNKLQEQLNSFRQKTLRLSRFSTSNPNGLIDSGATHPLRPSKPYEDMSLNRPVDVVLANGDKVALTMTPTGVMVTEKEDIEPILPMGLMATSLGCEMSWNGSKVKVLHPVRGLLPVQCDSGCPTIPRSLALELIQELEDKAEGISLKGMSFEGEYQWMKRLAKEHPVFRDLPQEVQDSLAVPPGEWKDLPFNKRRRKRMKRDGVIAHVYAGPNEGHTLASALQACGGEPTSVMEIDLQRGQGHDMLLNQGPYAGLLRCALEGKLKALIGGPNCRTRSLLRHIPIENNPMAPRPIRRWEGEEFGIEDATEKEKEMLKEDDKLMWRFLFLYVVSNYIKEAKNEKVKTWFLLEQPADPKEKNPEVVSFWRTSQWQRLKEEFNLEEIHFNQADFGGEASKPTTTGGNLPLNLKPHVTSRKKTVSRRVHDSKSLSRWSRGFMNAVAESLMNVVFKKELNYHLKAISWDQHVRNGHIPYDRNCRTCQQTLQMQLPHRRVSKPKGGVLSLDTTGPFKKAGDGDRSTARFLLVGAFTWMFPKTSKLKEKLDEEPELPPDALELPEEIEDQEDPMEDLELDSPPQDERPQQQDEEEEGNKEEKEGEEDLEDFEVRTFRLVSPMPSKSSSVVAQAAMEMFLRLRAEGFVIQQVHTDKGGEFSGYFRRWVNGRGLLYTSTPGDDPRGNGRAERAVQAIKQGIRRILHGAEVGHEMWPWAARHLNEILAAQRNGKDWDGPSFLATVLCKKRRWKGDTLGPTMDTVKYLARSWENHGHWVLDTEGKPMVTRYVIIPAPRREAEIEWQAVEPEQEDQQAVRRRIRGKTAVRKLELEEEEKTEEFYEKARANHVLEQEMVNLPMDEPDLVALEAPILSKLKKFSAQGEEEDEILQTKIVGQQEVGRDWNAWIDPTKDEIHSLIQEKEALVEYPKKKVEELLRWASTSGRKVEIIPSKLVFTKKPAHGGCRRKVRWVACGNYESKSPQEENYSGGADITSLRIMTSFAVENQWEGSTVDVKTAFLNAEMDMQNEATILMVKPPPFLVEKQLVDRHTLFMPAKALYGFRRSPRLWGQCRDRQLQEMKIKVGTATLELHPLQSEPNLWKIVEPQPLQLGQPPKLCGLMLTYVDDMYIVASELVLRAVVEKIRETWTTSTPDRVGPDPIKFLGMDISREINKETGNFTWYVNQDSYIRDMVERHQDPPRRIPISREAAALEADPVEEITPEAVRQAQQQVGELLWIVSRSRPDVMYCISRLGSRITKAPVKVVNVASQCRGYLRTCSSEGLKYEKTGSEGYILEVFSDASFAPEGEASHGCLVVTLNGTAVFWRSGRQHLIALSTAEAELIELVDAITAGESIAVVLDELMDDVKKFGWCDSQAALGILSNEGGNWRTRHLRFRSAFTRQLVQRGEWIIQHLSGADMTADIGTKPLSAAKIKEFKRRMGMASPPEESGDGRPLLPEVLEEEEKDHQEISSQKKMKVDKVNYVIKLIALAANLEAAKAQPQEEGEEKEWRPLIAFTLLVVVVTIFWTLTFRSLMQWFSSNMGWQGSANSRAETPKQRQLQDGVQGGSKGCEGGELRERGSLPQRDDQGQQEGEEEKKKKRGDQSPEEDSQARGSNEVGGDSSPDLPSSFYGPNSLPSWEEIDEQEERVRRWINQQGGSDEDEPSPTTPESPPTPPTLEIPFEVWTTKYGSVYHRHRRCGHLRHANARQSRLCGHCRMLMNERGYAPLRDESIGLFSWGGEFHIDRRCMGPPNMRACADCR